MANIKNLQMWNTICNDSRISVSKSMFGLRTVATYNVSNSVIDAAMLEFTPADGEKLQRLLSMPVDKLAAAIGDFHPQPTVNGNYMAEVCSSRDGAFLAVQLHQFSRMSYEPVTEVLVFEGNDARMAGELFNH